MNCTTICMGLGVSAGVGALVCGAEIGAANGVLFGVSGYVAGLGVSWICSKIFDLENSYLARVITVACVVFARLAAGFLAMSLVGIPITLGLAFDFVLQSFVFQWGLTGCFIWCGCCAFRNQEEGQDAPSSPTPRSLA